MIERLRQEFEFSLADAIGWAIVIALAAMGVLAVFTGCAAKPNDLTNAAIVRTQGATDRAAARVDGALERNYQMQRGLAELRGQRPEAGK